LGQRTVPALRGALKSAREGGRHVIHVATASLVITAAMP
jgi:hypothetical protein